MAESLSPSNGYWIPLTILAVLEPDEHASSARGYFWLVVLLTPTALLTIGAVDYQGDEDALERAAWSALGIVIGLAVAELWWRLGPERARGRPQAGAERGP